MIKLSQVQLQMHDKFKNGDNVPWGTFFQNLKLKYYNQ